MKLGNFVRIMKMPRIKIIKMNTIQDNSVDRAGVEIGIEILVWNGTVGLTMELYFFLNELIELGESFLQFPRSLEDIIKQGFICANEKGDAHLHICVSKRNDLGGAVLQFVIKQDGSTLDKEFQTDVSIAFISEIASINEFGKKLLFWVHSDNNEFEHEFWSDFYVPYL